MVEEKEILTGLHHNLTGIRFPDGGHILAVLLKRLARPRVLNYLHHRPAVPEGKGSLGEQQENGLITVPYDLMNIIALVLVAVIEVLDGTSAIACGQCLRPSKYEIHNSPISLLARARRQPGVLVLAGRQHRWLGMKQIFFRLTITNLSKQTH